MNRFIALLLCAGVCFSPSFLLAKSETSKSTNAAWNTGPGGEDESTYPRTSLSMLGWGILLAAGISLAAVYTHQSKAPSAPTTTATASSR